jgi:hypothetical protein
MGVQLFRDRRPVMRTQDGRLIRASDGSSALLLPADTPDGWELSLPRKGGDPVILEGRDALRALRAFLPRLNQSGGSPDQVRNAVEEVEKLGSAGAALRQTAIELQFMENMDGRFRWRRARPHRIETGHPVIRLALEMVANEETERRALDGELSLLEAEWKEAEELAAISDDLLFPNHLRDRLRRWKNVGLSVQANQDFD